MIYAVGDSHTWAPGHVDGCVSVHLTEITMHRLGRPSEASQLLTDQALNLSEDDALLLMCGEIDVRCHIGKQIKGRVTAEVIEALGRSAENAIRDISRVTDARLYFCEVIPPASRFKDPDMTVVGTLSQRVRWNKALNQELTKCFGSRLVTPYSRYRASDGSLNSKYADESGFHLDNLYADEAFGAIIRQLTEAANRSYHVGITMTKEQT